MLTFRISLLSLVGLLPAMMASADEVIRIMAANTSSGNFQSYDPGEGNRIFQGLDPDIALVQEMNVGVAPNKNTPATYGAWVTANFGPSFVYHVEATNSGGDIPNGIVSRYPIIASGEWDDTTMTNRDYAWAKIDIPGDKFLWAVSVHLKSGNGATQRNTEAGEIRNYILNGDPGNPPTKPPMPPIPASDYLVIGGDFNSDIRGESCITTLSSVVVTTGPYPEDQGRDDDTNNPPSGVRTKPYDWVMPDTDLDARKTPLVIGSNTFPNGLVFDSRVYTPLSQVAPVLFNDSGASGMQHMAVMRAFLIPTNELPVIAQGANISRSISQNNYPTAFTATLSAADADGDPLTWNISTAAAHGSATIVAPATGTTVALNYSPANDYLGSDSFTVGVSDGQGGTDTIVVNVTVNSVSAYDGWTFDRFAPLLPATQATVWGESANPDGDNYKNFAEFAFGLNPQAADVAVGEMQISLAGNLPVLSFLIRMDGGVPALNYELQSTTNPVAPVWPVIPASAYTIVGETVVNADFRRRSIQLNSPGAQPRAFYRFRITR